MPRTYTRKHQTELEDLYDILLYYKCNPAIGIVGRNITILSKERRLELLDWLWKQIHHKDLDYYGETLRTALHRLTPEQEMTRLEARDNRDILWRYQNLLNYHSIKEAKGILMRERGIKNEDALNRALTRARKKEPTRQELEEAYKKSQKQEAPTKKEITEDDLLSDTWTLRGGNFPNLSEGHSGAEISLTCQF
jgi:hypothetical protein